MKLQNYEWVEAFYDDVRLSANVKNGTLFAVVNYSADNQHYLMIKSQSRSPASTTDLSD